MRTLQILFDKRQPLFVPFQFFKALLLKKHIRKATIPRQIFFLITVDVENSWGDEEQESQKENEIFIKKFLKIKEKNTTFFLPGNLVADLKTTLKQLADDNEIGLHGHHHELWRSAYFVEKKAIKDKEKKELIVNSLSEFKKSNLNRPTSFRAPYMWCKNKDLKLLEEMGFKLDSSDRSQNGMYKIRKEGKILRIPVTVNPFPHFKKKGGLIFTKFRLFNLKILNELKNAELYEYIDQILRMQNYLKLIPHLVFIAHPWEFYGRGDLEKDDNFNHRGAKNYKILKTKLRLLENRYNVKYLTVNQFKELYENEEHFY